MGSRSSHLRTKVVALLASLAALWAFAAWVTLREGLNLLWVQTYDSRVSQPTEPLLLNLQNERRLSVMYLGSPSASVREALDAERRKAEERTARFKELTSGWQVGMAADDELEQRIAEMQAGLDGLAETRASIDARAIDRATAAKVFTNVLDSAFRVYESLGNLDDKDIAKATATLIDLNRVRELISQEDALLAGAIAAGRLTSIEYAQFVQLVGAQRFLAAESASDLVDADRARYDRMVRGTEFSTFRELENQVVRDGRTSTRPPVEAAAWQNGTQPALAQMQTLVLSSGDALVERATPVATWVIVRMLLAAGLGLIAVIASVVVSITTARSLVQQLDRLRSAAWDLANDRLPSVVARLGRGEEVDVAAEAPPLAFGIDEIGQVGQAFNAVQETAIRTAVEQADLRRSVRDVFLSLARRTQALLHRQLTLLDAMERRETDAEELEDLFRVDHLATRMRRNAENLIVLSGSTPGRTWRRNVPMIDVIRGAVAEVEDYARVTVLPIGPVGLAGRAVGDVIHLLAELIENALSFSPPHTGVQVSGQMVANGFVIEIEDRGLGMSEEDREAANERVASHPEFSLSSAAQLGLYVVSRLTERHNVKVHLKESPYGGTSAVVLIPLSLVTDGTSEIDDSGPGLPTRRATATLGHGQRAGSDPRPVERPALEAGSLALAESPERSWPREETRSPRAVPPPAVPPPAGPPRGAREASTVAPAPSPGPVDPAVPGAAGAAALSAVTAEMPQVGSPADQLPTRPAQQAPRTASGLPFRVRQASLAAPLREQREPDPSAEAASGGEASRHPDQVRRMMSSYQSGTRRGRSEAARLQDDQTEPPSSPADL